MDFSYFLLRWAEDKVSTLHPNVARVRFPDTHHTWVEFSFGSRPCSPSNPVSSSPQEPTFLTFNSISTVSPVCSVPTTLTFIERSFLEL